MLDKILQTEYSEKFDSLRKKAMQMSYYKYGKVKDNYKSYKLVSAIGSLEMRLREYQKTGNAEYLIDIANFAMIEFMYPQHKDSHYKPTDGGIALDGMSVNEIKEK